MASWEIWFRTQNVDEVRKSLGLLESQIRNETNQIHKDTGNYYPEIVNLSERLESLSLLGKSLESHIFTFANSSIRNDVNRQVFGGNHETLISRSINEKLDKKICSLIEISIVQKKLALAARALYLREVLGLPETLECSALRKRLFGLLQKWIKTGNHVSQAVFHASIIHMKLSPTKFLSKVLEFRISHIEALLRKPASIIEILRAIDSSIFIYNQVISDWGNARLSQRKIVDEPAFASILAPLDGSKLTASLSEAKMFPAECYIQSERPSIQDFTQQICPKLEKALPEFMAEYTDIGSLVDLMRETYSQAEASLSSLEKGLKPILDTLEPLFAQRLLELVARVQILDQQKLEEWETKVTAARSGLSQLAKIASLSKQYAPEMSERIGKLYENATNELNERTHESYKEQFEAVRIKEINRLLGLETAARLLIKLTSLNDTYRRLDGDVEQIPDVIYEDIAEGLWKAHEKRQLEQQGIQDEATLSESNADHSAPISFWGDQSMAFAFNIQIIMDELLGRVSLSPHGVELMRQKLALHQGLPDFRLENMSRSYLLLRPLSAQSKG